MPGRTSAARGEDIRRGRLVLPRAPRWARRSSACSPPSPTSRWPCTGGRSWRSWRRATRSWISIGGGRSSPARKIATSNSYTLSGMIRRAGGVPRRAWAGARHHGIAARAHRAARDGADVLVTTAGVSVGEHDLVRSVLTELGCAMKVWRVRMRPGAPLGFGAPRRARATALDRAPGQPGEHDGHVRAVRAAR